MKTKIVVPTAPPRSHSTPIVLSQITLLHRPVSSSTATPVAIIRMPRIEKNNVFTSVMEHDLVRAFNTLDQDNRVKAITITSKGNNFYAGTDLGIGLERTEGIAGKEHRDGEVLKS